MRLSESIGADARTAVRVLRKSPGTTALCVLSIALGIGLTTGIFSVGDAIMLRPLALERPGELFEVMSRADDGQPVFYAWQDFGNMARAAQGVAALATYQRRGVRLTQGDEIEFILANPVTPNFFSLLGVHAALGRASVESGESRPAVVLGYRLWQRRFGGDPQIVGKKVVLKSAPFVVTGVMPAEFGGLARGVANDVWVSMDAWFNELGQGMERNGREGQFEMVARLKPGVNPVRVAAQLDAAIRGPGKHKPGLPGASATVLLASFAPGWKATLVDGGGLLLVLGLMLFVACANVAQMRLAQAEARRKELGVRMALGAGSWRVTRQLLVETALLSIAGAALGLLLAQELIEKAAEFAAAGRLWMDFGIRLDYRVLTFTLLSTFTAVLIAGLAPARHAVRVNVAEILKSEQGVSGSHRSRQKRILITAQMAVSVLLLGIALLFLESFRNAAAIRPGIDPHKNLIVLSVDPGWHSQSVRWCELASEKLSGLPGVRAATFARRLPLSDSGGGARVRVDVPGQPPLGVSFNNVGGNYFSVMGTRVLAGRGIDSNDRKGTTPVVVISQLLAKQVFGARQPIGEWLVVEGKKRQVVGVAENGPSNDLHENPAPFLYFPFAQETSDDITLMVETAQEAGALAPAVRQDLKSFDSGVTIFELTTLRRHMDQALSRDKTMAASSTIMGVFGFLLTAAGLFGVIQYAVNRCTREIGLRVALGARPGEIQKLVLGEALRMAAWGIAIGVLLLMTASWFLRSLVVGVSALAPLTFVTSASAAVLIALAASWLPAHRAARVDPMYALRSE